MLRRERVDLAVGRRVADIERNRDQDVYLQLTPIVNRVLDAWRASQPIQALPSVVRHLLDIQVGDAGRVLVLRADQVRRRLLRRELQGRILRASLAMGGDCVGGLREHDEHGTTALVRAERRRDRERRSLA